jgi:hypothetical protein
MADLYREIDAIILCMDGAGSNGTTEGWYNV